MIILLVLFIGLFLGTGAILAFTGLQMKKDSSYIVNLTVMCAFFVIFWVSLGGILQVITYLITGRFV